MPTPKETYQTARLAQNTVVSDAQAAYGGDTNEDRDRIIALEAGTGILASEIVVDSTTLVGVGTSVQAVFEELDDAIATGVTNDAAVVTENAVNLAYRPLWSTLTADSADVNASEVLVDSGLSVTVAAGTYILDALVLVTTAAAADISFKWAGTATVTATVGTSDIVLEAAPAGVATVARVAVLIGTSWTTETPYQTDGALASSPFIFKGKLVVTGAGTIKLQFTQDTSDASNTHIDSGSFLVLQKVA